MFWKTNNYENDMEILITAANLVTFSHTVKSEGVNLDADGKKYVLSGALLDKDGNVVTQTGTDGAETLSNDPVGVLYKTVDVTNGDMACSLVVEGYLRADRVLADFADKAKDQIIKALPNIKFR